MKATHKEQPRELSEATNQTLKDTFPKGSSKLISHKNSQQKCTESTCPPSYDKIKKKDNILVDNKHKARKTCQRDIQEYDLPSQNKVENVKKMMQVKEQPILIS